LSISHVVAAVVIVPALALALSVPRAPVLSLLATPVRTTVDRITADRGATLDHRAGDRRPGRLQLGDHRDAARNARWHLEARTGPDPDSRPGRDDRVRQDWRTSPRRAATLRLPPRRRGRAPQRQEACPRSTAPPARTDPMTRPVVRRIFELFVAGQGLKQISNTLTDEGIPSPSAHDRRRNENRDPRGWAHSAVRTILRNEKYLGRSVWGKQVRTDELYDLDDVAAGYVTPQRWTDRELDRRPGQRPPSAHRPGPVGPGAGPHRRPRASTPEGHPVTPDHPHPVHAPRGSSTAASASGRWKAPRLTASTATAACPPRPEHSRPTRQRLHGQRRRP
jgi:hypothetical protein